MRFKEISHPICSHTMQAARQPANSALHRCYMCMTSAPAPCPFALPSQRSTSLLTTRRWVLMLATLQLGVYYWALQLFAAHACTTAMAACKARQASEVLSFPSSDRKLRAFAPSKPHCTPALP